LNVGTPEPLSQRISAAQVKHSQTVKDSEDKDLWSELPAHHLPFPCLARELPRVGATIFPAP